MAKKHSMTWYPAQRRWRKCVDGKWYSISCKQLGIQPETKEASWRAANAWWAEQAKLASATPDEQRDAKFERLVRDFGQLSDEDRQRLTDELLGVGRFAELKAQKDALLAKAVASKPDRRIGYQVERWKESVQRKAQLGKITNSRFDAYCRRITIFAKWMGEATPIDAIDASKLQGYFDHLTDRVIAGEFAKATAHESFLTARQFIMRLHEANLIPLPSNFRSSEFAFGQTVAKAVEVFTVDEVRAMLAAAAERTRLYLLLALNMGGYQNDLAEIRNDEVDWAAGTLTRIRSKMQGRGGVTVRYKLWPEVFDLLKQYRSDGDLVLTTEQGNPLVKTWLEGSKFRRYDSIQSAWTRLAGKMGGKKHRLGFKHLRKTSASLLGSHSQFKYFADYFLGHAPASMADRHYIRPDDREFFEALDWLRGQILGSGMPSLVEPPIVGAEGG